MCNRHGNNMEVNCGRQRERRASVVGGIAKIKQLNVAIKCGINSIQYL